MHENPRAALAPHEVVEEFKAIFEEMEEAHYSWDLDRFCSFYHPGFCDWRRFDGPLEVGVDMAGIRRAMASEEKTGERPLLSVEDLQVLLYGDDKTTAVATFYFVGKMVVPGRYEEGGIWRVTSVWAKLDARWKICHLHMSPLNLNRYVFQPQLAPLPKAVSELI